MLYDKIMALYPSLTTQDFLTVITLQNDSDGKGDYIAKWEHLTLAKPTDEQLGIAPAEEVIETPTETVEAPAETPTEQVEPTQKV